MLLTGDFRGTGSDMAKHAGKGVVHVCSNFFACPGDMLECSVMYGLTAGQCQQSEVEQEFLKITSLCSDAGS